MPPSDLGCDTPSVGCESPPSELGCATTPSCRGEAAAWGVNHGECKSGAGLSGAMSSESTTGPTEAAVSIAVASEVITLDWKKRSVDNRCCKEYVMDRTEKSELLLPPDIFVQTLSKKSANIQPVSNTTIDIVSVMARF